MGVLSNLSYIKSAIPFMCDHPDPTLTIQAAGAALYPVLVSAFTFGCSDILKMRLGTSPWHARKLRIFMKDMIRPGEVDLANKVFKYTIPFEKLLFFWFVVELTTEFEARWQSNIFKFGACGNVLRQCTKSGPLATYVCSNPGGTARISYTAENMTGACSGAGGSAIEVQRGWFYSLYFSLQVGRLGPNPPPTTCQLSLRDSRSESHTITFEPATAPWNGNNISAGITVAPQHPAGQFHEYIMEATCDQVAIGVGGSWNFQTGELPFHEGSIIPVNCFGVPSPNIENP
jgi:hypothetical protein